MRRAINAILVVAVLLGGAYLLMPERKRGDAPLFSPEFLRDVSEIRIFRPAGEVLLRRKIEQLTWQKRTTPFIGVVSDERYPVDEKLLQRLLFSLSVLVPRNRLESPQNDEFGLKDPEYRIQLYSPTEEVTLLLGKEHPFSGRRYATLDGKEIFLLDEALFAAILDGDYINRAVLQLSSGEVKGVQIVDERGESLFDIKKSGKTWERSGEKLDSRQVERFLRQLDAVQAVGSREGGAEERNLLRRVLVQTQGEDYRFELFGNARGEYWISLPNVAVSYRVEPRVLKLLSPRAGEFLNRFLFSDIDAPQSDILREIEVLSIEPLPGRLLRKSICEYSLDKNRFAVLSEVEGSEKSEERPFLYTADVEGKHFQGIVSNEVGKRFCERAKR